MIIIASCTVQRSTIKYKIEEHDMHDRMLTCGSDMRYLASEHTLSERMGLRLYAIALEPI